LFSIASNSKLFTALSAGLIVLNETITRGPAARLTQRTKIKNVVPEWELMDPIASNGTDLIDLLCMFPVLTPCTQTRLTYYSASDGIATTRRGLRVRPLPFLVQRIANPSPNRSVEEDKNALISRLRFLRPSTEFRQAWQYNNLAYIVASTFSEHIYGIPFETYVEDNILAPLGMNATSYDGALAKASGRRSDSFVRRGMDVGACLDDLKTGKGKIGRRCQGELVNVGFVHEGRMNAGPGGIITSGNDMVRPCPFSSRSHADHPRQAKWLKILLNNGQNANNETIIPSLLLAAAATPYTAPYQPPTFSPAEDLISPKTYGLAQEMYAYRGHYTIEHGGAVPGQMSQVMRVPGMGLGVAVMVNDNEFGTGFWQVAQRRIVDTLAGLEKIDWASR
jgi:CubicO group peptidase (beta-lactamase class C family)